MKGVERMIRNDLDILDRTSNAWCDDFGFWTPFEQEFVSVLAWTLELFQTMPK